VSNFWGAVHFAVSYCTPPASFGPNVEKVLFFNDTAVRSSPFWRMVRIGRKVPDSDWIFWGFEQKNLDFLSDKIIFGIIKY